MNGISSWAALLLQSRRLHKQTEPSRGTAHRLHRRTRHTDKTAGMEQDSPENGTSWTHLTWSLHTPLLHNALEGPDEHMLIVVIFNTTGFNGCADDTSFGICCTWISVMLVSGFTIAIDPPGLPKSLGTCFNQPRTRQEVITMVSIVVPTQTTCLPCPSWPQLGKVYRIQYCWLFETLLQHYHWKHL